MKKIVTAFFAVALLASVCIFYACKKEEVVKNVVEQEWKEQIVYMDIPCVDFSRIKKEVNHAKGTAPMLVFESWEHYASVIEAMLEFSYNYIWHDPGTKTIHSGHAAPGKQYYLKL